MSAAVIVASLAVAVAAMVMTVMHEHVHQRACQQEGEGQEAQHVGAVLREQEEAANGDDDKERNSRVRTPERWGGGGRSCPCRGSSRAQDCLVADGFIASPGQPHSRGSNSSETPLLPRASPQWVAEGLTCIKEARAAEPMPSEVAIAHGHQVNHTLQGPN